MISSLAKGPKMFRLVISLVKQNSYGKQKIVPMFRLFPLFRLLRVYRRHLMPRSVKTVDGGQSYERV